MDRIRAEKFQQLIDLLHQADALQQTLLGDVDQSVSYRIHDELNNLSDEIEGWAADEEEAASA